MIKNSEFTFKKIFLFILIFHCLLIYSQNSLAIDNLQIWEVDSMEKVLLTDPAQNFDGEITIKAAKNEYEIIEIVLKPGQSFSNVGITISNLEGPDTIATSSIQLYKVAYVNSDGVIRPDPLIPITNGNNAVNLESGKNMPIRFKIKVPKNADPGLYTGTIIISANSQTLQIPVELYVWDFTLPDKPSLPSMFGVTTSESFSKFYSQSTYNDKLELLKKFYDKFSENRLQPTTIAYSYLYDFYDAYTFNGVDLVGVDFSKMDPIFEYVANDLGFDHFLFPITPYVPVRWDKANSLGDYSWNNPPNYDISAKYRKVIKQYIDLVGPHFAQEGWLDKTYSYLTDEPCPNTKRIQYPTKHPSYEVSRQYFDTVQGVEPRIKKVETEEVDPGLFGYNNLWIVANSKYNEYDADTRRLEGEDVWWYNAGTRIQTPGIQTRSILWDTYSRNVGGILDWGVNYWTYLTISSDPWVGTNEGGDGYLLYPGPKQGINDDFLPSLRWENLGQGMEDYEYFKLLESKYGKNYVRALTDNIGRGSYFSHTGFEEVEGTDLEFFREFVGDKINNKLSTQTWYDSYQSTNNLDVMNNIEKGDSQEGHLQMKLSSPEVVLDNFETSLGWHDSSQDSITVSFTLDSSLKTQGTQSGKLTFRHNDNNNNAAPNGCYENNRNGRCYTDTFNNKDWQNYDYLEFDVYSHNLTIQNLYLHTNQGQWLLGSYSVDGTLPGEWHHIVLDLSNIAGSLNYMQFIISTQFLEFPNTNYIFNIDNMILRKKEFPASGVIESKAIHLNGVSSWNSLEWMGDYTHIKNNKLKFYTTTSSNGQTWSNWEEVIYDSNDPFKGIIKSPINDYIKYKVEFARDGTDTPTLSEIRINYGGTNLCQGKNNGDTCYNDYICCNNQCIFGDCCSNSDCSDNFICSNNNFCKELTAQPCTDADTTAPVGIISNTELLAYISKWRSGQDEITLTKLLEVINKWKNGC